MSLKHQIKPFLRRLGLMLLVTRLKYFYVYIKHYQQGKAFKKAHPGIVWPPAYMLYIAYGLNYQHYWEDGQKTAAWIREQFEPHLPEKGSILDWGCGPARITRHLPQAFPNWQVLGCDYDQATIDWCTTALTNIRFFKNELQPPLNLPDSSIQAAIGISIFTHLSAAAHEHWKLELARVLAPGGMLFVTTQGEAFQSQMSFREKSLFQQNELVIRATGPEGHKIYGAFHPVPFMRDFWGSHFEVITHQTGPLKNGKPIQDNWILKRK